VMRERDSRHARNSDADPVRLAYQVGSRRNRREAGLARDPPMLHRGLGRGGIRLRSLTQQPTTTTSTIRSSATLRGAPCRNISRCCGRGLRSQALQQGWISGSLCAVRC
jgi:hypothetical protein